MNLAIDVKYNEETKIAKAVGILFNWEDNKPREIIVDYIEDIQDYVSGAFYKRELPCLLKIIEKVDINQLEAIIIDGYIYIDNAFKYGLGGMLWEKLNKQIPIIGVAKTSFFKNKETTKEIFRGKSSKPLYVSAIGYDLDKAIQNITSMKGEYRMPTILKEVDRISKE